MRIAFVGKGGSGKTTTAAAFSRYLAAHGRPVVAVDADINQHLGGRPRARRAAARAHSAPTSRGSRTTCGPTTRGSHRPPP